MVSEYFACLYQWAGVGRRDAAIKRTGMYLQGECEA